MLTKHRMPLRSMTASATSVCFARSRTPAARRRLRRCDRTNETMPLTTSPPSHLRMFLTPLCRIRAVPVRIGVHGKVSEGCTSMAGPSCAGGLAVTVAPASLDCNETATGSAYRGMRKAVIFRLSNSSAGLTEPKYERLSHVRMSDDDISGSMRSWSPALVACSRALELEDRDH